MFLLENSAEKIPEEKKRQYLIRLSVYVVAKFNVCGIMVWRTSFGLEGVSTSGSWADEQLSDLETELPSLLLVI